MDKEMVKLKDTNKEKNRQKDRGKKKERLPHDNKTYKPNRQILSKIRTEVYRPQSINT